MEIKERDPREIDVPDAERLADESDRASSIEAAHNSECVDRVLSSIEKAPADFDGKHCVECGQEIVAARLKIGAFRDIHCQEVHERRKKQFRK